MKQKVMEKCVLVLFVIASLRYLVMEICGSSAVIDQLIIKVALFLLSCSLFWAGLGCIIYGVLGILGGRGDPSEQQKAAKWLFKGFALLLLWGILGLF